MIWNITGKRIFVVDQIGVRPFVIERGKKKGEKKTDWK
jgi:hypothetical protein